MRRVHTTAPMPQNTLKNTYLCKELESVLARAQRLQEQLGTARFFNDPCFDRRTSQDRRSGQERRQRLPIANSLYRRAMGDRRLPAAERILKLEHMLSTTTARQRELQRWLQNSY